MQWLGNKKLVAGAILGIFVIVLLSHEEKKDNIMSKQTEFWEVRSIDTMKYSRDTVRDKADDRLFETVIEVQVAKIADTGATHVAIGTPYDEEFVPFMEKWVASARRHNLNVWYRGNFSGWEEWFGYGKISREDHIRMTGEFIRNHPDLFEDGDIFSSCPECENGGPGDPRFTGDVKGYRKFLIDEYDEAKFSFSDIGKKVDANYFSMNGDVARLVMNRETTAALDGLVCIDHYVSTPQKLFNDVEEIARNSGGQVMLGEFGAPIPDIHGKMTQEQQADWIKQALTLLVASGNLRGINYWVSVGGSTELWNTSDVSPRLAVSTLKSFFYPHLVSQIVTDDLNRPIKNARVSTEFGVVNTNRFGQFTLPITEPSVIKISAVGFADTSTILDLTSDKGKQIKLTRQEEKFSDKIYRFFKDLGSKYP